MNFFKEFWSKICVPLDGFLWHRDISHPVIRPLLRNEILASGSCIIIGGALYLVFPWLFWFGCGLLCMAWIFWSWAKFFLKMDPAAYGTAFIRAFFLNFGLRFLLLAFLLYLALAVCQAPVSALLAGLACGAGLALISYAQNVRAGRAG